MRVKVTKYITALLFLLIFPSLVFADGNKPSSTSKSGNFKKSSFSKQNSWSSGGKALTPPNPNDATGGTKVPISGGLTFLLFGSTLYLLKRVKDENS
jgi:hypothetical protein